MATTFWLKESECELIDSVLLEGQERSAWLHFMIPKMVEIVKKQNGRNGNGIFQH